MSERLPQGAFCAGFFPNVPAAEHAIDGLLAAGFPAQRLGVVCPEKFRDTLPSEIEREDPPSESSPVHIAEGAAIGAALGGVALAAAAIVTGGAALAPSAMVLVGGGAIAGGLTDLIVSSGYRRGIDEYFAQAHERGEILVGVHLDDEANQRFGDVASILRAAGATSLAPQQDPTLSADRGVTPRNP
jgi:hypothetical protein